MNHLFVPYELALKAKYAEFDEKCFGYYEVMVIYDKPELFIKENTRPYKLFLTTYKLEERIVEFNRYCFAPLYQQLHDWFITKHNIHLSVTPYYNPAVIDKVFYEAAISTKDNSYEGLFNNSAKRLEDRIWINEPEKYMLFNDYYKAFNKALEEAFKLIESQTKAGE